MPTSVVVVLLLLLLAALSGHDSLQALLPTGLLQHKSRPSMQHKTSNKTAEEESKREGERERDSAKEVKLIFYFCLYLVGRPCSALSRCEGYADVHVYAVNESNVEQTKAECYACCNN